MSVLTSRRSVSGAQYVDTALNLLTFTLQHCLRFPKRYTFFISMEIVKKAQGVFDNVKSANSVYPTTAAEAQMRRDFLTNANCELQCLITHLDIARNTITQTDNKKPIKADVWQAWLDLITEEAKLIAAVKKSDKERYANLK